MKLTSAFVRLPIRFDAQRLRDEIGQFSEREWRPHPQGHMGNSALPFIAAYGDPSNEDTRGPMRATPYLERCPYLMQTLAALGAPLGRTRLMRIAGHGEATAHVDTNYYWAQRVRVHIPILTYPGVRFLCGEHEVFMDNGECWIFDTWRTHNVLNPDDRPRIHLVADTVGSETFWDLVGSSEQASASGSHAVEARYIPYDGRAQAELDYESTNFPTVMSPWEIRWISDEIMHDLEAPGSPDAALLRGELARFQQRWLAAWARYGDGPEGQPLFRGQLQRLETAIGALKGRLRLRNNVDPVTAVNHWIIRAAVAPDVSAAHRPEPIVGAADRQPGQGTPPRAQARQSRIERPVFIVAAPRSGSSLLFETLSQAANIYTVGGESHAIIEGIPGLSPADRQYESNRLTAADATPAVIEQLHQAFEARLRDRSGRAPAEGGPIRMLEKTPKNALRIPLLAAAFPDACFIYLYREPAESLASMIEAWGSGRFVTYPSLPGWQGPPWSLLLIPAWRSLAGRSIAEIAAAQWSAANRQIMDDLSALPAHRWCSVRYDQLLDAPQQAIESLCSAMGLDWDQAIDQPLPLSRHTLTPPAREKWRAHAAAIEPLLPALHEIASRAKAPQLAATPAISAGGQPTPPPLRSVHTTSFPELLDALGISVLATTYQAGRLVVLRSDQGLLNTHFRAFNKPMGMALHGGQLAIGTDTEIRTFRNMPAHTRQLSPPGRHDACFLPKQTQTTGDIQIHEMAWGADQLWFVNTRFSCLCTQDARYSFVPRWRPPFISSLAPEDRCHLNGMAMVDGRPRYVTALGVCDTPQGWRERKRDGGVLVDVEADEIIADGLSMPHSPRWYGGRLWVLNSGSGGLGHVDPASGRYQEVARLPGFTRGIDFYGKYAFIGLSQVRESAIFSGIAIAELPVEERRCGIWVVDITRGQTVAFVRFEDAVQEIFAIQVVADARYPELITDDRALIASAFVLPDDVLGSVLASVGR